MTQGGFGPEGINKPVKKYELWFIRFVNKVVKNNQLFEIVYFLIFQEKDFAFAQKPVWGNIRMFFCCNPVAFQAFEITTKNYKILYIEDTVNRQAKNNFEKKMQAVWGGKSGMTAGHKVFSCEPLNKKGPEYQGVMNVMFRQGHWRVILHFEALQIG